MTMRPFVCEFLGTPEAGKTTTIKMLEQTLSERNYKVSVVSESAETVPEYFKKGSVNAHFWMSINTIKMTYEEINQENDIILIDRGSRDREFWDEYYKKKGKMTQKQCDVIKSFMDEMKVDSDLAVFFTVPPEESIKRRGGEGRIVTVKFVKEFNEELKNFLSKVSGRIIEISTYQKSPQQVHDEILEKILKVYNGK